MRTDIIEYLQKEVYHRCKQPTNKFGICTLILKIQNGKDGTDDEIAKRKLAKK